MTPKNVYRYVTYALIVLPLVAIIWKYSSNPVTSNGLYPKEIYSLTYEFDLSNLPENTFVKAYLPQTNQRQKVSQPVWKGDTIAYKTLWDDSGKLGWWTTEQVKEAVFQWSVDIEGKQISYELAKNMELESSFPNEISPYLQATEHIQSTDPKIDALAKQLKSSGIVETLQNNFNFINQITNSSTGVLTDALTALRRNRASCNGKSRLFVALCRAQGIPARVVGGIILENASKRTSHLWAAVYYQGHWIPFDVLNQYFARLPTNYVELYTGDEFLITHTKGIEFDYQFRIQRKYGTLHQQTASNSAALWPLINQTGLPLDVLRGLILLPIVAVVVAILRNVIGLKTFGVFLPALIALGLTNVDLWWGMVAFLAVILVVALLHYPLEKFGLLHTPKLVIMMTMVVITLLGLSFLSLQQQWTALSLSILLPVIVLSITAERFAKTLVEEQLPEALKILGYTFLIAGICYPIFQSNLLMGVFLNFPETYLILLGIMLFLGQWIGMRVLEYRRFALLSAN
ncbi:MAG: 7TM domain-containing protein [Bacteroidota bacterium]